MLIFCLQIWAGPLTEQRFVVALWNRCSEPATITAKWDTIGLDSSTSYSVKDLWKVTNDAFYNQINCHLTLFFLLQHEYVSLNSATSFSAKVEAHASEMYIFAPAGAASAA